MSEVSIQNGWIEKHIEINVAEVAWCGPAALVVKPSGNPHVGLQLLDVTTGRLRTLTKDKYHFSPICSRDGKYVFFAHRLEVDRRFYTKLHALEIATGSEKIVYSSDATLPLVEGKTLLHPTTTPVRIFVPRKGRVTKGTLAENSLVSLVPIPKIIEEGNGDVFSGAFSADTGLFYSLIRTSPTTTVLAISKLGDGTDQLVELGMPVNLMLRQVQATRNNNIVYGRGWPINDRGPAKLMKIDFGKQQVKTIMLADMDDFRVLADDSVVLRRKVGVTSDGHIATFSKSSHDILERILPTGDVQEIRNQPYTSGYYLGEFASLEGSNNFVVKKRLGNKFDNVPDKDVLAVFIYGQ